MLNPYFVHILNKLYSARQIMLKVVNENIFNV